MDDGMGGTDGPERESSSLGYWDHGQMVDPLSVLAPREHVSVQVPAWSLNEVQDDDPIPETSGRDMQNSIWGEPHKTRRALPRVYISLVALSKSKSKTHIHRKKTKK